MYQSPFRVINADVLPQESEALRRLLSLEKKKLLAEFELAGSASITVGEQELHRQDVLTLFKELGNERYLGYHIAIWQDAALLDFLEEGRMSSGHIWASEPLYGEAGFLSFISPHFAEACNAFMQRALAGAASAEELQAVNQTKCLLLPADSEAAYRYVTRFFTEKKNELLGIRHRTDSDEMVGVAEIRGWCTDDQIHLLNCLPDTFTTMRYTLANTLNNLCVAYDRKKANRHALAAIERAATIRMDDEELRQLIPANLRIIRSKQSRTWYNTDPATGKKTPRVGLVIILIIVIIRIVTATNGCGSGSGFSMADLPIIVHHEASAQEQSFRALLKSLVKPVTLGPQDTAFGRFPVQYQLVRPQKAGDNPVAPLFHNSPDRAFLSGAMGRVPGSMLVRNQSDWEAIIIYEDNGKQYASAYVPPHNSHTILYSNSIALQLYAGREWRDSVLHVYEHYTSSRMSTSRLFRGGYKVRATIPYDDTTGIPMCKRQSVSGHALNDTISLFNAAVRDRIHVTYNLGND